VTRRTLTIETWDPAFGSSLLDAGIEPSEASVDISVEKPEREWRPIRPTTGLVPAERVFFVDGVRRVDAIVWINEPGRPSRRGICASFAAGVVEAAEQAKLKTAKVRRGLFSAVEGPILRTRAGEFESIRVAGEDLDKLVMGLQQRLGELEITVAEGLQQEADLIVVDGPLSGRQKVPGAIGYVKTHRVAYLPDTLSGIIGDLKPAERSPLFLSTTNWTRYSWYMRLPGPVAHSWSGVVRLEAAGELDLATARRLADLSTVTLPKYASVPHKDPRAPQNLFPIAGLERELKHRLGDPTFVERALRLAASGLD
jgi:hypothetical protein